MTNSLDGISLSDLAQAVQGKLVGADAEIVSVSTDSRSVASGDVYFCLKGDSFDGHDYAKASVASGAIAVVCERATGVAEDCGVAEVVVSDTRQAYGMLAKLWRGGLAVKLIGVTGSNGKTTVKQLLAGICELAGSVHCTRANDNNDIGVPQTLLGIDDSHQFAVVEMGANQLGEIEWLGSIVRPDVAIITNVSASHLEGFGNIESVCREKSAIYTSLADDGVAIVNREDRFADGWLELNRDRTVITFGRDNAADVYVEKITSGQIRLRCTVAGCVATADTPCQLKGDHNLLNIAAAAAAAVACGIDLVDIARGVANALPVKGRLNLHKLPDGLTVIDDTYNANPASVRAAIDVLASNEADRWLVLGDLKELGEDAAMHHSALGKYAVEKNIDHLFATGDLARYAVAGFGEAGEWFNDKEQLLTRLQDELESTTAKKNRDIVILVKGSRSMAMDTVVGALLSRYADAEVSGAGELI